MLRQPQLEKDNFNKRKDNGKIIKRKRKKKIKLWKSKD